MFVAYAITASMGTHIPPRNTPIAYLPQDEPVKIAGVIAPREAMLTSPLETSHAFGYTTKINGICASTRALNLRRLTRELDCARRRNRQTVISNGTTLRA